MVIKDATINIRLSSKTKKKILAKAKKKGQSMSQYILDLLDLPAAK